MMAAEPEQARFLQWVQIGVAVLAPPLTVWLARRSFVAQEVWKAKEGTYRALLDHLAILQRNYAIQLDQELHKLDVNLLEADRESGVNAWKQIELAMARGPDYVTEKTITALRQAIAAHEMEWHTLYDHFDNSLDGVSKCQDIVREEAHRELRRWWPWTTTRNKVR